jgi:DNA-binding IclR family transcriptional regulator
MAFQKRRVQTPVAVSDRIFSILETFVPGRSAMTLTEISRRSGLPMTTTYRLLTKLTEWGALERQPDRRYHIGWRLTNLAALESGQGAA